MRLLAMAMVAGSVMFCAPAYANDSSDGVDFPAFADLTNKVAEYRQSRLLEPTEFLARAAADGALILDTRSAEAFAAGHIDGAVNLPFSDFTQTTLRQVIGDDSDRPILIYCNNNCSDDRFPVALKRAELALNIPTFINLYGYGYENVWELDGVVTLAQVPWITGSQGS